MLGYLVFLPTIALLCLFVMLALSHLIGFTLRRLPIKDKTLPSGIFLKPFLNDFPNNQYSTKNSKGKSYIISYVKNIVNSFLCRNRKFENFNIKSAHQTFITHQDTQNREKEYSQDFLPEVISPPINKTVHCGSNLPQENHSVNQKQIILKNSLKEASRFIYRARVSVPTAYLDQANC